MVQNSVEIAVPFEPFPASWYFLLQFKQAGRRYLSAGPKSFQYSLLASPLGRALFSLGFCAGPGKTGATRQGELTERQYQRQHQRQHQRRRRRRLSLHLSVSLSSLTG